MADEPEPEPVPGPSGIGPRRSMVRKGAQRSGPGGVQRPNRDSPKRTRIRCNSAGKPPFPSPKPRRTLLPTPPQYLRLEELAAVPVKTRADEMEAEFHVQPAKCLFSSAFPPDAPTPPLTDAACEFPVPLPEAPKPACLALLPDPVFEFPDFRDKLDLEEPMETVQLGLRQHYIQTFSVDLMDTDAEAFGGATSANPFGTSQMFSSNSSFGTPVFGQTSGGVFGAQNAQQPNQLFSSANTTFGPPSQTAFGSTSLFGQQAPPASSSLFMGSNSMGSLAKPSGFAFGSSQPSIFGQTPQPTQQSNIFQPSTSSNIFGSSGTFGSAPQATTGTTIKFTPVTGTDSMQKSGSTTVINTKHHSITCMKEYESKSFEELRFEDYSANRKGPSSGGFGTTSGFGATPLFGQTENKSTFGATTSFGAPSFGQTSTAGAFGKSPPAFGTTATSSATGFGFSAGSTIFGNAPNKPFGQTTQPMFGGAQPQQTQPGFGTGGIFGQQPTTQTNTGFMKPTQPTFGAPQTGTFSVFGQTPASTPATGLFQTTKPSTGFSVFGQNTTTTASGWSSGFGTNTVFGKPTQPTFGQPTQTNTTFNTGFNLTSQPSMFGNLGSKPTFGIAPTTNLFGTTSTMQPSVGLSLPAQQQTQPIVFHSGAQSEELKSMLTSSDPYGYTNCLDRENVKKTETHYATNPRELETIISTPTASDSSSPRQKRAQVTGSVTPRWTIYDPEDVEQRKTDSPTTSQPPKPNPRRLNLRTAWPNESKKDAEWVLKDGRIVCTSDGRDRTPVIKDQLHLSSIPLPVGNPRDRHCVDVDAQSDDNQLERPSSSSAETQKPTESSPPSTSSANISSITSPVNFPGVNDSKAVVAQSTPISTTHNSPREEEEIDTCGVICTRPEYYTLPALDKLHKFRNPDGSCFVQGFTIGRTNYGNIHFFDVMNVANLNIDEIVHIRFREAAVYLDDDAKPPVGEGLNRPAQVTLDQVYPRDSNNKFITRPELIINENYAERLKEYCKHMGTEFVDYRPETGSWVFRVAHFSKYGMPISDEDNFNNINRSLQDAAQTASTTRAEEAEPRRGLGGLPADAASSSIRNLNILSNITFKPSQQSGNIPAAFQSTAASMEKHTEMLWSTDPTKYQRHVTFDAVRDNSGFDWEPDRRKRNESLELMKDTFFDPEIKKKKIQYDDDFAGLTSPVEMMDVEYFSNKIPERTRKQESRELNFFQRLSLTRPDKDILLFSKCSVVDAALFKKRSFKCGWYNGLTLYAASQKDFTLSVIRVSESALDIEHNDDAFVDPDLQDQLFTVVKGASTLALQGQEQVPLFQMKYSGNDYLLQEMASIFEHYRSICGFNEKLDYFTNVWHLIVALWGTLEEPVNCSYTRKDLLSDWLRKITAKTVNKQVARIKGGHTIGLVGVGSSLRKIFIYLSGNQIENALDVAMSAGFPQLALIISQLNSGELSRFYLTHQLQFWKSIGVLDFIENDVIRMYLSAAGLQNYEEVDVHKGLDWICCFAFHLWYMSPAEHILQHSIQTFEDAFNKHTHISKPHSKYGILEDAWDIFYHILKLYCNNQTILDEMLCPQTHNSDLNDYRMSWLMQQVLISLGVGLISDTCQVQTASGLASQLEEHGNIKWAVFVSLHLKDVNVRRNAVMAILDRHLSESHNDKKLVNFLVEELKLPVAWIHTVKAYKNQRLQNPWQECKHFAYTGMWYECHKTMITELAPKLVCNYKFDVLLMLLKMIEKGRNQILRWKYEGGLLLQFVSLWNAMQNIEPAAEERYALSLESEAARLIETITHYTQGDYRQTMIAAELSKDCLAFYQAATKHLAYDNEYIQKSLEILSSMLMPYDYKYVEMNKYITMFFKNLA